VLAAAVIAYSALALGGSATPAVAAEARAAGVPGSPVTFTYTGGQQAYAIPGFATAVVITAVGAPGGGGDDVALSRGNGASVTATVPVAALPAHTTTLYVEVGGAGTVYSGSSCGAAGCLAGGGGASDVRTTSIATVPDSALTTANDSRLVVAGGGGGLYGGCTGGGSAGDTSVSGPGSGGNGAANQCNGGNLPAKRLTPGTYHVTATYPGSADYRPSASPKRNPQDRQTGSMRLRVVHYLGTSRNDRAKFLAVDQLRRAGLLVPRDLGDLLDRCRRRT